MSEIELNMDRAQRCVIDTAALQWESSPAPGVWRKKLEREAAESGQVTSIVLYDAGTHFAEHGHPGGEEIFVLDGVFEDEHGSYPAGSYLRNPIGFRHAPKSTQGCTIFVKLNMFKQEDVEPVNINMHTTAWLPGSVDGLSVMPLHAHGVESTALVRWQAGTQFNRHTHPGGEEIYVIDGVFADEHGRYPCGTWLRNPSDSTHQPFSDQGCTILVKVGHL